MKVLPNHGPQPKVPIALLEQELEECARQNTNDCSINLKGSTVSGPWLTGDSIPFYQTAISNGVLEVDVLCGLRNVHFKNVQFRAPDGGDVVIMDSGIKMTKCRFEGSRGSLTFCGRTKV